MRKVLQIGRSVKITQARMKEICEFLMETLDGDMKAELIHTLTTMFKTERKISRS
jgi:hypothetical protein